METKFLQDLTQVRKNGGIEQLIPNSPQGVPKVGGEEGNKISFGDFMKEKLAQVNSLNIDADQKIRASLSGDNLNPHSTLIAVQKADISFRLLMSVQQKIVQAYQQIIRTPL